MYFYHENIYKYFEKFSYFTQLLNEPNVLIKEQLKKLK